MRPRPSGSSAGPRRRSRTRPLPSRAERKPWISRGPASVGAQQRAGREGAGPAEALEERALGPQGDPGRAVGEGAEQAEGAGVVLAGLDGQGALAGGRGEGLRVERDGRVAGQPEAAQAGGGQDDRVQLAGVDAADPAVDVAADRDQLQVGAEPVQQGDPARAAGPDPGPWGQVVEAGQAVAAEEHVAGVVALGHGGKDQAGDLGGGQVLGRVHGQVGPPVQHRLLHGRGEDALAAEGGRRHVAAPVALGDHRDQLDPQLRPGRPQPVDHQPALGEGEGAPPRGQPQGPAGARPRRSAAVIVARAGGRGRRARAGRPRTGRRRGGRPGPCPGPSGRAAAC